MSATDPAIDARLAAAQLVGGVPITAEHYSALRAELIRHVGSNYRGTPGGFAEDVVDQAVEQFLRAISTGRQIEPESAFAYLRTIARNVAVDLLRKNRGAVALDQIDENDLPPCHDDEIAQLIEKNATAALIEEVLARAAANRDLIATRVMNDYLRLADQLGTAPTIHQVAEAARVDRKTVQNVLKRMRKEIRSALSPK